MAPKEAKPDNQGFRYITAGNGGWRSQVQNKAGYKMLKGGTYDTPREAAHGSDW